MTTTEIRADKCVICGRWRQSPHWESCPDCGIKFFVLMTCGCGAMFRSTQWGLRAPCQTCGEPKKRVRLRQLGERTVKRHKDARDARSRAGKIELV